MLVLSPVFAIFCTLVEFRWMCCSTPPTLCSSVRELKILQCSVVMRVSLPKSLFAIASAKFLRIGLQLAALMPRYSLPKQQDLSQDKNLINGGQLELS
jgi:hypothetical protein